MAFIFIIFHLNVYSIYYTIFCDDGNYEDVSLVNALLGPEQKCKFTDVKNVVHEMKWNTFVYFMTIPLPYLGFLIAMKNLNKYINNQVMIYISSPSNI